MAGVRWIHDPVYGPIAISDPLYERIIDHPWFQRLRRIRQLGFTELVFPSAVHTRFQHALGTFHLGQVALKFLRQQGISISVEEERALLVTLLVHDLGHGPFSHALEGVFLDFSHETLTRILVSFLLRDSPDLQRMVQKLLTGVYPRPFLNQLVCGVLDLDRLDYLARDSFFAGVSEGQIGYERILRLLTVHPGTEELALEAKALPSIERFLAARLAMYRQVYLHKTVLSAENMLQRLFELWKKILPQLPEKQISRLPLPLQDWIRASSTMQKIQAFIRMTDDTIYTTLQVLVEDPPTRAIEWLARGLLTRRLHKVVAITGVPPPAEVLEDVIETIRREYRISREDARDLVILFSTHPGMAPGFPSSHNPDEGLWFRHSHRQMVYLRLDEILPLPERVRSVRKLYFLFVPLLREKPQSLRKFVEENSVWI